MPAISQAIATNLPSVAAAQTAYSTSVVLVTNAMLQVTELTLPTLFYPPSNWDDFVTTFTSAKSNANLWASDVLVQLYDVPADVNQYNSNIAALLAACASYAQSLEQAANPLALSALQTDLGILSSQLSTVSGFISGCQSAVQSFNDDLPSLLSQLQTLSADFTNQEQVDQQQVQQLNTDIANLHNDINTQIGKIVGTLVVAGAMAYVGGVSGWTPLGWAVKLIAVFTVAVATYGIDLAADEIAADKAAIVDDTSEINNYTADAQNCAVVVQSFQQLVSQMSAVSTSVTAILAEWNELATDMASAIADATQALADTNSAAYSAALADIQGASEAWSSVDTLAQNLVLPTSVSSAQFEPGMTPAEVVQAVQGASSTDITAYLANVTKAAA